MFEVTLADIRKIANEYSIDECPTAFYELQRYNYDEENKIQRKYDLSSKWFLKSILLLLSGSKTNGM